VTQKTIKSIFSKKIHFGLCKTPFVQLSDGPSFAAVSEYWSCLMLIDMGCITPHHSWSRDMIEIQDNFGERFSLGLILNRYFILGSEFGAEKVLQGE